MNSKKLFYVLIALLIIVNGSGVALLVFGNKYLDKQNAKLTDLKVESETIEVVQRSLIKAKKDLESDSIANLNKVVSSVVPQEKDQARTVRELVSIAERNGILLSTISFPSSTLGNNASAPGAAAPATTITQTKKVDGITNVERLEISVQTSDAVPYKNFISFLQQLEQNRRTAQVSNIAVTPSDKGDMVTFSLVLNVYIKKATP